jgi:hypothetical protein
MGAPTRRLTALGNFSHMLRLNRSYDGRDAPRLKR